MADTKELVEAGNYLTNAFLLKPAPLPLGRSGVADVSSRYFRLLFQWPYIDFDKKVGSGLIFLTVAFCLVFNKISLSSMKYSLYFVSNDTIISSTFHLCHSEFKEIAFSSLMSNWKPPLIGSDFLPRHPLNLPSDCKLCYMYISSLFSCPKVQV